MSDAPKPEPEVDPNAPKSVKIPPKEIQDALMILHERHGANLAPGEAFSLRGELSHGEAFVHAELRTADDSDVLVLDLALDLDANEIDNPTDGKNILLDCLDDFLSEYFEEERLMRFSPNGKIHTYKDYDIEIRGSRRNVMVEKMADAWLAEHDV